MLLMAKSTISMAILYVWRVNRIPPDGTKLLSYEPPLSERKAASDVP
jgi:hypothetical protein